MNYAVKLLQAAATDWADREALVHHGERISFGTLARRTAHLAAQLGAEQGAVAVLSRNQPQALIAHLACHMAGRPVAHIPRDAARAGQETWPDPTLLMRWISRLLRRRPEPAPQSSEKAVKTDG
ncbi:AMP-binding protein [Streptomyces sp. NPDC048188]|uniref:AMP-binding protein n=1 Tax=Streptomyces sp. NPDC048188 TaxID=3155749 RepID=UPI00342535D9